MPFNQSFQSKKQVLAYRQSMLKYDIVSFRIACLYGSIHIFLFIIIDYWRATNFPMVLLFRSLMIVCLGVATLITYRHKLTVLGYDLVSISAAVFIVLASFLMDFFSGIPPFFLSNFLCLLFYVYNAGLGYSIKTKIIYSLLFCIAFFMYAFYLSPNSEVQISQSFNVLINALISILVGYLIERYKRLNYVQRQTIESLSNFKTKLISVLSHDLSSPLNQLKGLISLRKMGAIREEELDQHSSQVERSLETVSGMLQNLVKWTGTQLNGFQLSKENIYVKETVDEVIQLLKDIATRKSIEIDNQVEPNARLFIDKEILKIVLRNFTVNAIKFSRPGSSIVINSTSSPLSCTISVLDKGIGMSPEDVSNIFQLKQKSGPGTENERGSGIGLIITKEFAEMMKGTIKVVSELGVGSTFSVTFPNEM